jgi:hypothetical protein
MRARLERWFCPRPFRPITATRMSSLAPITRAQDLAGRTAPAAASAEVFRNVRREVLMGRWAAVWMGERTRRAFESRRPMRMRAVTALGNQPN